MGSVPLHHPACRWTAIFRNNIPYEFYVGAGMGFVLDFLASQHFS